MDKPVVEKLRLLMRPSRRMSIGVSFRKLSKEEGGNWDSGF